MINKKNLSEKSVAFLPKLILLLGAVMPVAENKDELYYTCAISSIVAFLLYVAIIVTMLRHSKDRKKTFVHIWNYPDARVDFALISIAGLLVDYSLDLFKPAIFWWVVLLSSFIPFPKELTSVDKD